MKKGVICIRNIEEEFRKDYRELWLRYFNKYLFTHGIITEKERDAMREVLHEKAKSLPFS